MIFKNAIKKIRNTRTSTRTALLITFIPLAVFASLYFSPDDSVLAIVMQDDGRVLIGGRFSDMHLKRMNADGSLDINFQSQWQAGGFNGDVMTLAIHPDDDSILVGGDFTRFDISLAGYFVKLDSEGLIDSQFMVNAGTGFDGPVSSIAIVDDGSILVAGDFTSYNGNTTLGVALLNFDGTLNQTFLPKIRGKKELVKGFSTTVVVSGDIPGYITQLSMN